MVTAITAPTTTAIARRSFSVSACPYWSGSTTGFPVTGTGDGRPPRGHRARPTVVYVAPGVQYAAPAAVPAPIAVARQPAAPDCLVIREYQTRIVVGGREVEAYGDACLQPDGSWRTGPPKIMPD